MVFFAQLFEQECVFLLLQIDGLAIGHQVGGLGAFGRVGRRPWGARVQGKAENGEEQEGKTSEGIDGRPLVICVVLCVGLESS